MRHIVFCLALSVLVPQVVGANDVQIAQQIAAQLRAHQDSQQLKGFHIGVKVDKGNVWMKGQVSDPQQQSLAIGIARQVPGVRMVVNELHVVPAQSAPAGAPSAAPVRLAASPTTLKAALRQPESALPTATNHELGAGAPAAEGVLVSAPPVQPLASVPAPVVVPAASQMTVPAQAQLPLANPNRPMELWAMPSVPQPAMTDSVIQVSPATPTHVHQLQANPPAMMPAYAPPLEVNPPAINRASPMAQPQAVAPPIPMAVGQSSTITGSADQMARQPRPIARMARAQISDEAAEAEVGAAPVPLASSFSGGMGPTASIAYDHPSMPPYAWPSYAAYPNYAAVTYPRQYSPTAWPYIGPFYPYPQVPLGWRKVTLEWDDGWWFLDFKAK
jgi:hypothetical protein